MNLVLPHPHRKMRPRLAAAVIAVALVMVGSSLTADRALAVSGADDHRADFLDHSATAPFMTVSHLGAWHDAPENSLAAIGAAIAVEVPITELDVWKTADGELVLMHDPTVDRTTDGTGAVSSLTLAQIKQLRLRDLRGGTSAALTTMQVPTLGEALAVAEDEILLNIDKTWGIRDDVYAVVAAAGMQDQVIFKSDAPVAQVDAFLTAHPDAMYCHIINDANASSAHTFVREPDCYEVIFDSTADAQAQPAYLAGLRSTSRVWMNTLWRGLAGDFTDEASFRNIMDGWGGVAALGATIIQTDHPAALQHWIAGGSPATFDLPAGSVRVYARDYAFGGEGIAYHDLESSNIGGKYRPAAGVDICDQEGTLNLCWIRAGEWIDYTVLIPQSGDYSIQARVSTKYSPGGSFTLEFADWSTAAVPVRNTTSHNAFLMQDVAAAHHFEAGTVTFRFRVGTNGMQNFNLDYVQFDPA